MNESRAAVQTGELQKRAVESHAARGQPVEVRRMDAVISVRADHIGSMIVRADPEDVEPPRGRSRGLACPAPRSRTRSRAEAAVR